MNKKIIISLSVIAAAAAVVIGGTSAFFSDTETSTGNTFTAGAIDLKVDSQQHYNGMVCVRQNLNPIGTPNASTWQPEDGTQPPYYPAQGSSCDGTWEATDLGAAYQFFDFRDVKPGDFGENTISLHVDNDAWLRLVIKDITDLDVTCTEPEATATGEDTGGTCGGTGAGSGELRENLSFSMWLDQGEIPGFQGRQDNGEGDNIQQCAPIADTPCYEPTIISSGTIDAIGETWDLANYTPFAYLIGGQTAYFGVDWNLPSTVGNEAQTDSMSATMEFQVVQHRNNPTPAF